jgi:uncharacterized protein YyaL (SSP411 family)
MAFIIKGLYYYNSIQTNPEYNELVKRFADRLVNMYKHESDTEWKWFESYLTYANSILPEALLCAYILSGNKEYKDIAKSSFDFLLANTFNENRIRVISNKSWMKRGEYAATFGEQPIDVAYTIITLNKFYQVFKSEGYLDKMEKAFTWFLGNNHLRQVIYNPCTGGCFDGLEENHVNLNQGAESSVSYLVARLEIEKYAVQLKAIHAENANIKVQHV